MQYFLAAIIVAMVVVFWLGVRGPGDPLPMSEGDREQEATAPPAGCHPERITVEPKDDTVCG